VRRDAAGVRLFTRNGHDWTGRFPLIGRAALALKAASCLIDGEAVACDDNGLPVFDRLTRQSAGSAIDEDMVANITITLPHPATSCSATLVNLASKASCRRSSARPTAPAAHGIG
jgi:hypothetical protein